MVGKKVFIVVLILLVIAYIALTVVGAKRGSDQKNNSKPVKLDPDSIKEQLGGINLSGIQDALLPPPALAPTELRLAPIGSTSADCIKLQGDLIVPQAQTCVYSALPVEKNFVGYAPATRKLSLTLTEGDGANLTFAGKIKQGDGAINTTAEQVLLPGVRGKPLDIYQDGGLLTILCPAGASKTDCRLKLAK